MKMEKLNDYQIKFLLSQQDLQDRNITFGDLFRHSDKLQRLVREIMKLASERINFNVTENPVMVEAHPHPDGIVLIVSRTPDKNDNLITEEYKRHLANIYNDFIDNRFSDIGKGETTTRPADKKENKALNYIFAFSDFDKLAAACKICAHTYSAKSTLFKMQGKYYLVLTCLTSELSPAVLSCLGEYGETLVSFNKKAALFSEYGDVIIRDNAVSALAGC